MSENRHFVQNNEKFGQKGNLGSFVERQPRIVNKHLVETQANSLELQESAWSGKLQEKRGKQEGKSSRLPGLTSLLCRNKRLFRL